MKATSTTSLGELLVALGFVSADEMREAVGEYNLWGNRMGEALIALGFITRSQLQRALAMATAAGQQVVFEQPRLGDVLLGLTAIDELRLDAVLRLQSANHRPLGMMLVEMGDCTTQQVDQALDVQERMRTAIPEEPDPTAHAKNGVRVMVVDDSVVACAFVAEGLEYMGYDVIAFEDPLRALEQLDEVAPDIVVTDLNMPEIDGSELCRRIKSRSHSQIPVVILTASESEAASMGLRAGADDYVRKGTSMEELSARIDAILRRTTATAHIRKLFARYTSDAVVDEVLRTGDVVLTGEKRVVTILFADIRNFTSIAESLPPEQVMNALNDVLGRLADAVLACGGTLDKYLGDGLMAVFGAPVKHDDDAQRALAAGDQMIASVAARNQDAELQLHVGVAINTGVVVVGSIGNARRTEYTCIGDAVNVAARLSAIAGAGEILLGLGTVERLEDRERCVELPPVQLKGKAHPVPLFRVAPPVATTTLQDSEEPGERESTRRATR